jgi:hypothetical protein
MPATHSLPGSCEPCARACCSHSRPRYVERLSPRCDRTILVVRRQGAAVDRLVEWTAHEAITRRGAEPATNQVRVAVEPDSIRFLVNARPVGALPRSATRTDGHLGLRLGEGINVHVTNVELARRLLKRR